MFLLLHVKFSANLCLHAALLVPTYHFVCLYYRHFQLLAAVALSDVNKLNC